MAKEIQHKGTLFTSLQLGKHGEHKLPLRAMPDLGPRKVGMGAGVMVVMEAPGRWG